MPAKLLLVWFLLAVCAQSADFTVKVRDVRNDRGMVRALLFSSERGFPDQAGMAAARVEVGAGKGAVELVFKGVQPGRYALAVLHDENSDGKLDTNFIGIPKEGVGVSGVMGNSKPAFAACVIDVAAGGSRTVAIKYW